MLGCPHMLRRVYRLELVDHASAEAVAVELGRGSFKAKFYMVCIEGTMLNRICFRGIEMNLDRAHQQC